MGAGSSGLEKIAKLNPRYLKFDRELVSNIDSSYIRREMTRALKAFADRIGSTIIAEGIEREGELQTLLELGIEYGQGFLLGRPAAAFLPPAAPTPATAAPRAARPWNRARCAHRPRPPAPRRSRWRASSRSRSRRPGPWERCCPGRASRSPSRRSLAAAAALALAAWRGGLSLPAVSLWPLAGFLALALAPARAAAAAAAPAARAGIARRLASRRSPRQRRCSGRARAPSPSTRTRRCRRSRSSGGLALLALVAAPGALARATGARARSAAVALAGFALSAYAILARARFGALLYGRVAVPTVAPFGPFVSKNHFAGWSAMAALLAAGLALGLAAAARRRGRDWTADARAGSGDARARGDAGDGARLARLDVARRRAGARRGLALPARAPHALGDAPRGPGLPAALALTVAARHRPGRPGAARGPRAHREPERRVLPPRDLDGCTFALRRRAPLLGHGLGAFHDAYPRFKRG